MARQARVGNPFDIGTLLEVLSECQGVLCVALSSQAESLNTKQQLLSGERVQRGTQVAQDLDTSSNNEGDFAKCLPELQTMITFSRLDKLGETLAVLAPIELSRVDNDTADGGTVTTNPFGSGVDDNISAVVNGADKVTASSKSVVHYKRDTFIMGNLGNGLEVGDAVLGVANALNVDSLGVVVNRSGKLIKVVDIDKLGLDSQTGEEHLELVVGAAVQVRGGNNVVTGVGQGVDCDELGTLAGRSCQCRSAAF